MQEYIDLLNNFIVENQAWAGPVIFLLTFGESMLIIGLVIPATAILVATGGLIGAGSLSPWPILIWGIAGAIIGDAVSYYIGRWLGWDITKKPMFANYRPFFVKARLFFKKYGTLSVFLGRFLGPIRSTIPAVAGIMGLDHIRFQIANITSAILWMPVMLSPGYFAGRGAKAISESGGGSSVTLILTVASVILGVGLVVYLMMPRKKTPPSSKIINVSKDEFASRNESASKDEFSSSNEFNSKDGLSSRNEFNSKDEFSSKDGFASKDSLPPKEDISKQD